MKLCPKPNWLCHPLWTNLKPNFLRGKRIHDSISDEWCPGPEATKLLHNNHNTTMSNCGYDVLFIKCCFLFYLINKKHTFQDIQLLTWLFTEYLPRG